MIEITRIRGGTVSRGGGSGGLDIHHRGVGGGTRNPVNDLPQYNFEDHDIFNTSFCWGWMDFYQYVFQNGLDWQFKYCSTNPLGFITDEGALTNYWGIEPGFTDVLYRNINIFVPLGELYEHHVMIKEFTCDATDTTNFVLGFGTVLGGLTDEGDFVNYGAFIVGDTSQNVNLMGMVKSAIETTTIDLGIEFNMYDRHKLHTHFTDVFARFYVDDILCGEILYADHPDSWPIGLYLIPELGIKNDSDQNTIYWQLILPMIHADLIYVGGGT